MSTPHIPTYTHTHTPTPIFAPFPVTRGSGPPVSLKICCPKKCSFKSLHSPLLLLNLLRPVQAIAGLWDCRLREGALVWLLTPWVNRCGPAFPKMGWGAVRLASRGRPPGHNLQLPRAWFFSPHSPFRRNQPRIRK